MEQRMLSISCGCIFLMRVPARRLGASNHTSKAYVKQRCLSYWEWTISPCLAFCLLTTAVSPFLLSRVKVHAPCTVLCCVKGSEKNKWFCFQSPIISSTLHWSVIFVKSAQVSRTPERWGLDMLRVTSFHVPSFKLRSSGSVGCALTKIRNATYIPRRDEGNSMTPKVPGGISSASVNTYGMSCERCAQKNLPDIPATLRNQDPCCYAWRSWSLESKYNRIGLNKNEGFAL